MGDSLSSAQTVDLGVVDVTFLGIGFAPFTIRNYSSDSTSIDMHSTDKKLYNKQVGAFGDMLLNKSYKAKNFELHLFVQRKSQDYGKLQNLVALELAGTPNVMTVTILDNNNKEKYASVSAVMEEAPGSKWGPDTPDSVEFVVSMPSTSYIAPTNV